MIKQKTTIGLVDDHQLIVKSLGIMISYFDSFEVVLEAFGGKDLEYKLSVSKQLPDIMLIDVNMPTMDGPAVATWLNNNYPAINLIALSMNEDEGNILKMIKAGCCSYLFKSVSPAELEKALLSVSLNGYYNGDINIGRIIRKDNEVNAIKLSERELQFLQLACSDRTYQQIAAELRLSESRIDDIRAGLFDKFNVKSRVGLALEAVRKKLVELQ